MKKISKVLCLVLVLAMMAGLCCFGTSAAFADADKINYKEAADVLEATKIMVGDENGFRPADGLTRAEACVMIAKLCDADTIKGTCSFKDVKGHWGEQYIAYCAAEGYVSGYSATKFGPDDALTGSAWALMLLRVLGYDPAIEGIGGDTWEIGVAKLVKKLDLAKGIADFDGTAKITREEAAQLTLNALQTDMVEYKNSQVITVGNVEIKQTTTATPVVIANGSSYGDAIKNEVLGETVGNDVVQLGEFLFKDKLEKGTAGHDDFGRPANSWTYKAKIVGTFGTADYIYTTTAAMSEKDLFAAIGAEGIQGTYDKMLVMDKIYCDGVEVASVAYTNPKSYTVTVEEGYSSDYANTAIITKTSKDNIPHPVLRHQSRLCGSG